MFAAEIRNLAEPGKMPDCPIIVKMTTKAKSANARIETRVSSDLKWQLKKDAAVTGLCRADLSRSPKRMTRWHFSQRARH